MATIVQSGMCVNSSISLQTTFLERFKIRRADPLTNIRRWHRIEQKIFFPGRAVCLFKAKITQINLPRAVESE
jgi:hypothetical protein